MALPEDIQADLDEAYDRLALFVSEMIEDGYDIRAIIGGMGRLYAQLVNEEFHELESRMILVEAVRTLLMRESH